MIREHLRKLATELKSLADLVEDTEVLRQIIKRIYSITVAYDSFFDARPYEPTDVKRG
jgi:hypothetical protein